MRLVARTIAKQVAKEAEQATGPFQNALSTKAGCKCVAHTIQTMTDQDAEETVVSIDGDLISRQVMLEGLLRMTVEIRSSLLCGCSAAVRPHMCGKTRWAIHRASHKREGSKATPSCRS